MTWYVNSSTLVRSRTSALHFSSRIPRQIEPRKGLLNVQLTAKLLELLTRADLIVVVCIELVHEPVGHRGKVHCNHNEKLCARFGVGDGVSTDGEEEEVVKPSLPYILWFKGGKAVEPYSGELTLAGLMAWVAEKHLQLFDE